jgi:16S rRNA (cytidine1402-2'-O)-methyltransferase
MSTLYVIATPIGNLDDATFRSVETLKSLDLLFVEDTRVTGRLLERYGIKVPMQAYREDNHGLMLPKMLAALREGKTVGLVSDAGTPAIADPGFRLVRDVLAAEPDTKVIPIAGASAVATALSISGFSADQFTFMGFPPHKKGRNGFFKEAMEQPRTVVLYESTHRIEKALDAIYELAPERKIVVCRELTKMFETIYRGTAAEVKEQLAKTSSKGEYVIVIQRAE